MKCPKIVSPSIKIAENIFMLSRKTLVRMQQSGHWILKSGWKGGYKVCSKAYDMGEPSNAQAPPIFASHSVPFNYVMIVFNYLLN